jgi:hypothetical protein
MKSLYFLPVAVIRNFKVRAGATMDPQSDLDMQTYGLYATHVTGM